MLEQKMNCIIIHGCPSNIKKAMDEKTRTYDKHWIHWLKRKLEDKGIETYTPLMPEPWIPNYKKWKEIIDKLDINQESTLIGHSCGGGFLVRYLGDTKKKIKKLILVAPSIIHSGEYKPLNDLLKFEIKPEVKNLVKEIIIFVSNDDSKRILKSVDIFSKNLGGKVINLKNHGHYTLKDMGTTEFPELIKEIMNYNG